MERDWVGELEQWLQECFAGLCETIDHPLPPAGLRINPALGSEESKYFLLGLEAGLFQPDELGYVQSALLPPLNTGNTRQKTCQIFSYDPLPPRLIRESICQLSTASSLILERGWLESHLLLDPDYRDDHAMSYGIDIVVKSPTGHLLICVEIKRSTAELQKLVTDLRACCKRGPHAKDDCGFPQNHPKYEFCAVYKPDYFWAVAPDSNACFEMKYGPDSIGLEEMASLPPRSLLELP